ncbi:MAG: hypothetical protein LBO73_04520, partial [Holosporaceae bacterium]|nr:hypothetical protein [Holosporaceae bacterium]
MNKVVAILGIIVLITLGGLFFCAGFFTGTNISPVIGAHITKEATAAANASSEGKSISKDQVDSVIGAKSVTISEKIMQILSSAAESATSSISRMMDGKKSPLSEESSKISVNSLLREIAAGHASDDECSPEETLMRMKRRPLMPDPNSLQGKRIVFVGYFKNKVALKIQKLLVKKGYRPHVEISKTGDNESFVFCGPFKKEKNAEMLVKWLRKHEFSEARIVKISDESLEEALYDTMNGNLSMPENKEKEKANKKKYKKKYKHGRHGKHGRKSSHRKHDANFEHGKHVKEHGSHKESHHGEHAAEHHHQHKDADGAGQASKQHESAEQHSKQNESAGQTPQPPKQNEGAGQTPQPPKQNEGAGQTPQPPKQNEGAGQTPQQHDEESDDEAEQHGGQHPKQHNGTKQHGGQSDLHDADDQHDGRPDRHDADDQHDGRPDRHDADDQHDGRPDRHD